jgi:hypothetical protein
MKPYYRILWVDGTSVPKVKHATLSSAQTEAERLSRQHPGRPFEILKCVGISQTTTTATFWMDGEALASTPLGWPWP